MEQENNKKTKIMIIIIIILSIISMALIIKENKQEEIINIQNDTELYEKLNELMTEREYNEYAIKVINTFIPDYQKIFTNNEIYKLFTKVSSITINPYDPENPDLSHTNRAYNSSGNIVVNCFEGELDNDGNMDGLRWLLTHEIMHSLGSFPDTFTDNSFGISTINRNGLLEEGLADSIADQVKGVEEENRFAIKKEETFKMYPVNNDYAIDDYDATHTYTLHGNVISLFKYIGCYDEVIDANINKSFDELKVCMSNNVTNGEEYFEELFKLLNEINVFIEYPNTFLTKEEALEQYEDYLLDDLDKLLEFIENNNIYDLIKEYEILSSKIINNKIDETYSICDFYKTNVILYSDDGINYKSDINCDI